MLQFRNIIATLCLLICLHGVSLSVCAQVLINEAGNRNATQLSDEEGKYEDWIELFNAGTDTVNLFDYGISDDASDRFKWTLPDIDLLPGNFLTLFASGKDRKPNFVADHFEAVTGNLTYYTYIVPTASTSTEWMQTDFIPGAEWLSGQASIGYGDGDDATIVPTYTLSAFLLYNFSIDDTSKISDAKLFVDFDDGFVAYLNGVLIAQYGFPAGTPAYDALSGADHEAAMYAGYDPQEFYLDFNAIKSVLIEGTNVFAIEVHNVSTLSSDLTIKPFLIFGISDTSTYYDTTPPWFNPAGSSTNLHTNFKIDTEGENIFLTSPDASFTDSVFVICQQIDNSHGRQTDGSTIFSVFANATPGESNNGSTPFAGYMEPPVFDSIGGFYSDPIEITITCPDPDAEIYFSTNGNVPTNADVLYTGAILLDVTTVIKAACFDADENYMQSKTTTATYFIDVSVSLPVISITTDDDNLYGYTGIYDNWWEDWKKPCYIEYFNDDKEKEFGWNSALKIDGGAGGSRSLPQKSFRVEPFNDSYGDGVLNYPLIPRKWFVQNYETFYLRNGSNFWNVLPYKDAFMVRTLEGTHNDHMAYTPVIVYLNGNYWGLYELREKLDAGRFKQANGMDKDSMDVLSMSYWYGLVLRTLNGSDTGWYNMRDFIYEYPTPDDTLFYDLANAQLDLKNFADYMIAETWFGNYDWPWNNIKMYRDRGGENKWKYAVIDVEWGIGYGWSNIYSDLISYMMEYNDYTCPIITLMQNPQFYNYFINRYADLMNSTFLPERTLGIEDSIFNMVMPEMGRQLDTWGNGSPIIDQLNTFLDYRNAIRSDFELRSDQVRNHLEDYFDLEQQNTITVNVEPEGAGHIKFSTLDLYNLPWSGIYFQAVPVEMTATPNTGFTFSHWNTHPLLDDELNATQTFDPNYNTTFTAVFTGSAMPEEIVVSEINYNSESTVDAGDWIEIYNYGLAEVNISGWKIQDADPLHQFIIPEGTNILPYERLVVAENITLFNAEHPEVSNYIGPLGFGFSGATDNIKLFTQQDIEKVNIQYFDSLPWPKGADAQGRTLELYDPTEDLNDPNNWFDGCIGGSPGLPYSPCIVPLVFSEINYNSNDTLDANDWVEVWNISDTALDISNWKFMDDSIGIEHTFIIPEGRILNPDERWVFAQTISKFTGVHPDVENYDAPFYFNLNGNGEWIRMYDADGRLTLSVNYQDVLPWPTEADGGGYTLELIDALGKMNAGENWTTLCVGGSPGASPSEPCEPEIEDTIEVQIAEFMLSDIIVFPNPADAFIAVQTTLPENAHAQILLYSLDGILVQEYYNGTIASGSQTLYCNMVQLSAGIYFVSIIIGGEQYNRQVVKL